MIVRGRPPVPEGGAGDVVRTGLFVPEVLGGPVDGCGGGSTGPGAVGAGLAAVEPLPVVTLESVPDRPEPGGEVDLLVMASNPHPVPLLDLRMGVVVPAGLRVGSTTPPAGCGSVVERCGRSQVVRCHLPVLGPGGCSGLEVVLTLPRRPGRHRLTAFLTQDDGPALSLTCRQVLQVGTDALHLVRSP